MTTLTASAHAKLNLTLDVVGRREDGYHDLEMVMQEITLGDEITLTLDTGKPWQVISESGEIPCNEQNLAVKAAKLFFAESGIPCDGMTIEIRKNTPVCAGMGGGSSDGAAVLRLLQTHYGNPIPEERLYKLAEMTGSDVPFALFGGTALAKEKGQVLSRLPAIPECEIVLCKPGFPISTPELFRAIDREQVIKRPDTGGMLEALENGNLSGVAAALYNVFSPVVEREHPEIRQIKETMMGCGAENASMTGSGPTVFGIFADREKAENAYVRLKERFEDTFLTKPV